jgi:hypothetical protein
MMKKTTPYKSTPTALIGYYNMLESNNKVMRIRLVNMQEGLVALSNNAPRFNGRYIVNLILVVFICFFDAFGTKTTSIPSQQIRF